MSGGTRATGVGAATIVTIFAVLCLSVFSALTLLSAASERELAQKAADAAREYYEADYRCTRRIAAAAAGDYAGAEVTEENGAVTVSFSEPVNDRQEISVLLRIENGAATVLRRAVADSVEWLPDDDINVWDGK